MIFQHQIGNSIDLGIGVDQVRDSKLYARGLAQVETARLLLAKLERLPGMILGDEVGMGKTWIALLAALAVAENDGTVLVITPSGVLAKQWENQFRDLIHQKLVDRNSQADYLNYLRVYRREPYKDLVKDARDKRTEARIFVTSIGSIDQDLRANYRGLETPPYDLIIVDEGHNFKNEHTRRYQAFHKRDNDLDPRPPVLYKQFRRALLLTATPFQLGHYELRGVLRIFEAAAFEGNIARYQKKTAELISALDVYQKLLARFERRWSTLDEADVSNLLDAVKGGGGATSIKVSDAADVIKQLIETKQGVNERLLDVIIRNVKGDAHRQPREWGIDLAKDKQLLFFLSERLDHVVRRSPTKVRGHLHALPSSYGRYEDHLKVASECDDTAVRHYVRVCSKLFHGSYRKEAHPKLDRVADAVFEGWKNGEKSIVFCGFLDTVKEFREALEQRVGTFVNQVKKTVDRKHRDHEKFVERLRLSRSIESLVTCDNAVQTSLIPLVKKIGSVELTIQGFTSSHVGELAKALHKLRFNPENPNYRYLLGALEHVFFKDFQSRFSDAIPTELEDDFSHYCDIARIKDHLVRREVAEGVEAPASLESIVTYVEKAKSSGRLSETLAYPSIWGRFSGELENIRIDQRLSLTEIVSHYLTSDEFLYLSLLSASEPDDLRPENLVERLWETNTAGESIGSRVHRFLVNAAKLESKTLEGLIADMGNRYILTKNDAARAVLEVVTGGVDLDQKLRTVTAFKAPFAPYILVTTSVLSEGVDLHTECRTVYHYDHEWNPATLEQKNGRVDRVGSKAERDSTSVLLTYPFLRGTQDQKAREIVKARASWFNTVMGKDFGPDLEDAEIEGNVVALPEAFRELLIMRLDNAAHRKKRSA